jgi:DNA processing protein
VDDVPGPVRPYAALPVLQREPGADHGSDCGPNPGRDEVSAWLRLITPSGLGTVAVHRLLGAFGMPQQVLAQPLAALASVIPVPLARALLAPPDAHLRALIERTQAWLRLPGNHMLTLADDAYPHALLDLADPPPVLYLKGKLSVLRRPGLAMVGARSATVQGMLDAEEFARTFSDAGLTVVSGLALGIDAAAHAGGLEGPGGTIAVTGTGVDLVYPARNRELAHRVVEHGAIVSEFALGTRPCRAACWWWRPPNVRDR